MQEEIIETNSIDESYHFHIESQGNIVLQYNDIDYSRFCKKVMEHQNDYMIKNMVGINKNRENGFNYKFVMYKYN